MGQRAHRVGRVHVRGDSVLLEPSSIGRGERIPEELRDGSRAGKRPPSKGSAVTQIGNNTLLDVRVGAGVREGGS